MTTIGYATSSTDTNALSVTFSTASGTDPVTWSLGDWAGWGAWGAWPQSAMPFQLADDTVADISTAGAGAAFPTDSLGIINSTFAADDEVFSATDTVNATNPGDSITASWTFDIAGASDISFSVDFAAMGDFEATDLFGFTYSIDGGPAQSLLAGSIDEAGSLDYTMENGSVYTYADPAYLGGVLLSNQFQTISAAIAETGSTLTVTFTAATDGGSEVFAFDNLLIEGIPTAATPVINEFEANPAGSDPATQSFELKGTPGTSFSGWIISIETDAGTIGSIDSAEAVSGTFDSNGLLVVSVADLENPSFTVFLTSEFNGTIGTDIDLDDDGTVDVDTAALFGIVYDAIGVADATGDVPNDYADDFGGEVFNTGAEPQRLFRDGTSGAWYAVNTLGSDTSVIDTAGAAIAASAFDSDPTLATTYGAVNESLGGTPVVSALINEFEANPLGSDPATQSFELKGTAGASFAGWIISIETDAGSIGTIDAAVAVSGTFDANGLLVVDIPDLENPSFTLLLTSDFTGSVGDDVDIDDDGTVDVDTAALFGTVFDAIGVADTTGDVPNDYADDFGGEVFDIGSEPARVFRDRLTDAWYAVDGSFTTVYDSAGNTIAASQFDSDPTSGTTFGGENETFVGGPLVVAAPYSFDFETAITDAGWSIVSLDTDTANTWYANSYSGDSYAEVNGFGDSATADDWLISPFLDLSGLSAPVVSFQNAKNFSGPDLVFAISTDFDGTNVGAATWTELSFAVSTGGYTDTFSGEIDLSAYAGQTVSFAYIYQATGTTSGTAAVYQIDDFYVGETTPTLAVKIHDIQGSTNFANGTLVGVAGAADESPLLGAFVQVEAVVTQLAPGLGGFYIQEEASDYDADDYSSEGIFVASSASVSVGQLVTVQGAVQEVGGETQIAASTVTGGAMVGLPAATAISFPTATVLLDADGDYVANLEAYEGMLVTIAQDMTVTELFQLDRFGTIRLSSDGRLEQYTQSNAPSTTGYDQFLQDIAARSLVIDDGTTAQNPSSILVSGLGTDGVLDAGDVIRMGDYYSSLTGVIGFGEDAASSSEEPEYRLQTPTGTLVSDNARPTTPDDVGSDYKVGSLNVLNFFTTLDEYPGTEGSGPNALEPRGADTNPQSAVSGVGATDEYERQLSKLVEAIIAMECDVVGLVELENDFATGGAAPITSGTVMGSGVAIQELVEALNTALGATVYDWVRPSTGEFVGSDAIAVGFIYDTTTTSLTGASAVLDTAAFLDPNGTGQDRNRAALAQTFTEIASGESFTASINHLKSKGSGPSDTTSADADQLDGAGAWNDTRTKAAAELAAWLATDPTGTGDTDVIILGDLNSYAAEDPITALKTAGYTDLAQDYLGSDAYSYVFDGQTGTLDYALANASLAAQVTGVTEFHINADEADVFDYNLEFGRDPTLFTTDADTNVADGGYRASDHDPVIVGLDLGPDEPAYLIVQGKAWSDWTRGTDADEILIASTGKLDRVFGGGGADLFYYGAETLDGRRQSDIIKDYEIGVDAIALGAGVQVTWMHQAANQVILALADPVPGMNDLLFIRGEGVSVDTITILENYMLPLA